MNLTHMKSGPVLMACLGLLACANSVIADEVAAKPSDRMARFNEEKFGMFIHWGIYSVQGETEKYQLRKAVPLSEYGKFELIGMTGKPAKVYLLADPERKPLEHTLVDGDFSVTLPESAPGSHINVLCVEQQP